MSETRLNPSSTQTILATLLAVFRPLQKGKVALYQDLARRLSETAGRSPPWTWRYVQGVLNGTLAPSPRFAQAVRTLQRAVERVPRTQTDFEEVKVYARPGAVQPGAIVLPTSRPCANPACPTPFIPVDPEQTFCPICQSSYERRKA